MMKKHLLLFLEFQNSVISITVEFFEINAANKPVLESLNHIYTSYHLQSHAAMEFDAHLSNQESWDLVPAHYANGI